MKIIKNNFQLVILLSFLFSCKSYSQTNSQFNFTSPESILKFADHLFSEGDYLRAIYEYKNYPDNGNNDSIIFKIALCYSKIGDIKEAVGYYQKLLPRKHFSNEACIGIVKLFFLNKEFSNLEIITRDSIFRRSQNYSAIERLSKLSLLYMNYIEPAINIEDVLLKFPVSSRGTINNLFNRKINPPYKSSVLAAVLSGVIPGAGKIYTGYYGDGISTLILTGILGYTSYSNFKADHRFRGWLFGTFGGIFYLGNIYGSAVSAQIRNSEIDLKFKIDLDSFLSINKYFLPDDKDFCK